MRLIVWAKAVRHCALLSFSAKPDRIAATNTPVPAADSQLIVKRAASGLAFTGAIGGIRCTRLCSDGMSQNGRDNVPPKVEPSSVVVNLMSAKRPFRNFLNSGMPQSAQHRIRITHGSQAYAVSFVVYLYSHSCASAVAVAVLLPSRTSASRSLFSRKRVFGCHTKRRKSAVHTTEKTPDPTSVIRCSSAVPDANHCISANEAPAQSAAGHTSNTSFHVPPSIFTKVATSQNGTRIDTKGNWRPAIVDRVS